MDRDGASGGGRGGGGGGAGAGGKRTSASPRPWGARPADARAGFARGLSLAGWDGGSTWGYDAVLECYWADLRRAGDASGDEASLVIGPEHLISTITGLARAVAFAVEVADVEAYLALTERVAAPWEDRGGRSVVELAVA